MRGYRVRETLAMEPAVWTLKDGERLLKISTNTAYSCVHQGQIPHLHVGRLIRVPKVQFKRWMEGRHTVEPCPVCTPEAPKIVSIRRGARA